MVKPFPIKRVMASNTRTDLEDTERARGAFARLGFGKMRNDGTDIYLDQEFFDAMGGFQTYHRLRPDEVMAPNGETAHMLGVAIEALERGRRVRGAGAVLGVPTSFRLKGPVVDGAPADADDVRTTRRVLAVLGRHGLGDALRDGPMIDGPMIHGIGGLQKEDGMFPTGGIRPGDRTERLIERLLKEVQVDEGPADEVLERDDDVFEFLKADDDEPADEDRGGARKPIRAVVPDDELDLDAAHAWLRDLAEGDVLGARDETGEVRVGGFVLDGETAELLRRAVSATEETAPDVRREIARHPTLDRASKGALARAIEGRGVVDPDAEEGRERAERLLSVLDRRRQDPPERRNGRLLTEAELDERADEDGDAIVDFAGNAVLPGSAGSDAIGSTDESAVRGRRLAQRTDEPERDEPRLDDMNEGGRDDAGGRQDRADEKDEPVAPDPEGEAEALPRVPAYRAQVFDRQPGVWTSFNEAVADLDGLTEAEEFALPLLFAAEGGTRNDPGGASSGITEETLARARARGGVDGIEDVGRPADLSVAERAAVMRDYFDDVLHTVDGGAALDDIGNRQAAAAFADVLYREGRRGGTRIIQRAINEVRPDRVVVDGRMGPQTLDAYRDLAAEADTRERLLDALGDVRDTRRRHEADRNEFFRFRDER